MDFSELSFLVIGDIMIDEYIDCNIIKMSDEAPIPILKTKKIFYKLGGAGNVALNISKLHSKVFLVGNIGRDEKGEIVNELCNKENITFKGIIYNKTTVKTRILAKRKQLVRFDDENIDKYPQTQYDQLYIIIKDIIKNNNINGVIVEDYEKGVLKNNNFVRDIIKLSNDHNIKVFVDPKGTEWSKYHNSFCIIPNELEYKEYSNYLLEKFINNDPKHIINILKLKYFILKLGKNGIKIFQKDKDEISYNSITKEVVDVTGAGDTFISILTVLYCKTNKFEQSCRIANRAAGLVVKKIGTSFISLDELNDYCLEEKNKLYNLNDALKIINKWKKNNEKIVFTNGCFDLLHHGHIKLLKDSKKLGTKLIVALNSDNSIKKLKGNDRPILDQNARYEILNSIEYIDLIIIFEENNPLKLIELIKPDVLTKGNDYKVNEIIGYDFMMKINGKVITIQTLTSTTEIIKKIQKKMGD